MLKRSVLIGACIVLLGCSGVAYALHLVPSALSFASLAKKESPYVQYELEAMDQIKANYWNAVTDADLVHLFQLSVEHATNTQSTDQLTDHAGLTTYLNATFAKLSNDDEKRKLAVLILQTALYNLQPIGRSELLATQDQQALSNTVNNVNPNTNLYSELGLPAAASVPQVQAAYVKQVAALKASSSPEAAAKLQRTEYVHEVLADTDNKARYDATGAEPTVFAHAFGSTLYLDIKQMSPTTLQELIEKLNDASTTPFSSLLIDLRGNIGGDLDVASQFGGPFFFGAYAFNVLHLGQTLPQPTSFSPINVPLSQYKETAVLTDGMTQSTAEIITAALKARHLATVIGTTTRGWGSIEGQYPLSTSIDPSTKYELLLVSALTLRDDAKPIEGQGVTPDIPTSDANWKAALAAKIQSPSLRAAIEKMVPQAPLR